MLAHAATLATDAALSDLHFDIRYACLLLAAIRNDAAAIPRLVEAMHEVLDYTRPNCVALYYQHLARVRLMHDQVAQAFEAATHALRAAQLAACVAGEQRGCHIMHALALLASAHPAPAQSWAGRCTKAGFIYKKHWKLQGENHWPRINADERGSSH